MMICLGECPQLAEGDIQALNRWAGLDAFSTLGAQEFSTAAFRQPRHSRFLSGPGETER
jgi:hypothetical protein